MDRAAGLEREPVGAASTEARHFERSMFVMGGVAAVVGSLAGMVGNLIHPAAPIGDPEGVARVIADSGGWTLIHLIIVVGILLMLGGLAALHVSLQGGGTVRALARMGLITAVAGITIGLILVILDGVAAKQLADAWAVAPSEEEAAALRIVLANETVNFALASLFNIVFAGATFILFGLAVARSDGYPGWWGWVAVAAGVISVGAGLIQAFTGEPTQASRVLTIIGPTVITLWVLVIGILLLRKARRLREAHTGQ